MSLPNKLKVKADFYNPVVVPSEYIGSETVYEYAYSRFVFIVPANTETIIKEFGQTEKVLFKCYCDVPSFKVGQKLIIKEKTFYVLTPNKHYPDYSSTFVEYANKSQENPT